MQTPLLSVRDISVRYAKREVLHGVTLDVRPGEIVAVLGHNGAGKTTLLNTVLGINKPTSGSIEFDGAPVTSRSVRANVLTGMSLTAAERPVFRELTVVSNLRLGAYGAKGLSKADLEDRVEDVFSTFPRLRERSGQLAGSLSGGEQRMLALGIALVSRPKLMLLDEPSVGLAPAVVQDILSTLAERCETLGMSILVVEQNVRSALRVAHRVYYLRMGAVVHDEISAVAAERESFWEFF
ncbi:ABC transporter ATP-binding protein [Microbacterium sp. BR1]|uniref:ABC transporter ATP-binding protein n=1 Tax=Microbacterium sp. BR1 TaxID=1070896 RepID=UPI0012FDDCF4|nr:ABC transporter ATP-binding protein [Microbacterium sp. BR1]